MDVDKKITEIIALPESERVAAMKKCAAQVFQKGLWTGVFATAAIAITFYGVSYFVKKSKKS